MLVSIYRIRTLEKNYPNPAEISQCSITVLTKTMLIITCRMFSRCHDSEDCNRTYCETFSCVRQLTRLVVLVLISGHCVCYTNSVCIPILISAEPLILTHRTQFKNHCSRVSKCLMRLIWTLGNKDELMIALVSLSARKKDFAIAKVRKSAAGGQMPRFSKEFESINKLFLFA